MNLNRNTVSKSMLLIFGVLLTINCAFAVSLNINDQSIPASSTTFQIPVLVASVSSTDNFGGMQFDLDYDTSYFTLSSVSVGDKTSGFTAVKSGTSGSEMILVYNMAGTTIDSSGSVVLLNFQKASSTGATTLKVKNILLSTSSGSSITPTNVNDATDKYSDSATITISAAASCGNNLKEIGEECDGTDLDEAVCTDDSDFDGGTLSCNSDCELDGSDCCEHACEIGEKSCTSTTSYGDCTLGSNGCRGYYGATSCGGQTCDNGQCVTSCTESCSGVCSSSVITNGQTTTGTCCDGGESCYACTSGYSLQGTTCVADSDELDGWIMFVSSDTHNGDFGGIEEADKLCQAEAVESEYTPGTYIAFLGATDRVLERGAIPSGGYVNTHGEVIASGLEDLFDGNIGNPVKYRADKTTATGSGYVWTGLTKEDVDDGIEIQLAYSGSRCSEWTSTSGYGNIGHLASTGWEWANYVNNPTSCGSNRLFYCVQVAKATPSTCEDDETDCSGTCVDITSEENNCGSCGTSCVDHATCTASSCVCDIGYSWNSVTESCDEDTAGCTSNDNCDGVCSDGSCIDCVSDEACGDNHYCLIDRTCVTKNILDDCTIPISEEMLDLDCNGNVRTSDAVILLKLALNKIEVEDLCIYDKYC
jgi:hypothetical protein